MSKKLRTALMLVSLISAGYIPMNQAIASNGGG